MRDHKAPTFVYSPFYITEIPFLPRSFSVRRRPTVSKSHRYAIDLPRKFVLLLGSFFAPSRVYCSLSAGLLHNISSQKKKKKSFHPPLLQFIFTSLVWMEEKLNTRKRNYQNLRNWKVFTAFSYFQYLQCTDLIRRRKIVGVEMVLFARLIARINRLSRWWRVALGRSERGQPSSMTKGDCNESPVVRRNLHQISAASRAHCIFFLSSPSAVTHLRGRSSFFFPYFIIAARCTSATLRNASISANYSSPRKRNTTSASQLFTRTGVKFRRFSHLFLSLIYSTGSGCVQN